MILYQGKHVHEQLSGCSAFEKENAPVARTDYQELKEDSPKSLEKDGVLKAESKSELQSVQEDNSKHKYHQYMSINVFASFVHSLSDLIVMIGVFIAAIIIKIKVFEVNNYKIK